MNLILFYRDKTVFSFVQTQMLYNILKKKLKLKVWISDKWIFALVPHLDTKSYFTEICDFKYLFSTLQCKPYKPIRTQKTLYLINSVKISFFK